MKPIDIIPVIHVQTLGQSFLNVETILSSGLKKAMLISMDANADLLMSVCNKTKREYPDLWVGANFLEGHSQISSILARKHPFIDAIWSDRTPSSSRLKGLDHKYEFFGGLAFKYQPQPKDLEEACLDAMKCMTVITTSGVGTGQIPDVDKIESIRSFIGDHPLAIASGVSSENIPYFVGLVNHVLVASSITEKHNGRELIVPSMLKNLIATAASSFHRQFKTPKDG